MFCKYCGGQIPDGSPFCPKCGMRQVVEETKQTVNRAFEDDVKENPQPAAAAGGQPAAKSGGGKKWIGILIAGIAALVVLVGVIALIAKLGGGAGSKKGGIATTDGTLTEVNASTGEGVHILNAKGKYLKIEDDDLSNYEVVKSLAGDKYAIKLVDYADGKWPAKLLYYDGEKLTEVVADEAMLSNATISADGNTIVYEIITNDTDGVGDIYIYSGKKSTKIAEDAKLTAISPNGKTVAYIKYSSSSEESEGSQTYRGYYYAGGKEVTVSNNSTVIGLANDAKYVYFMRESADDDGSKMTLYVQQKDKEKSRVKLFDSSANISYAYYNTDHTQMLIYTEKGTFLVKNGAEPEKLSSASLMPLLPDNFAMVFTTTLNVPTLGVANYEKIYYGASSNGSGKIVRITKDGTENVATGVDDMVKVCPDNKTIIYEKGDSLYKVNASAKEPEPEELLDLSEVKYYFVTDDAKTVFYSDSFYDFFVKKGTGKATKIFEGDKDAANSMLMFKNKLYMIYEGELYVSDGGKAKKISAAGSELYNLDTNGTLFFFYNENGDWIVSADGKKFTTAIKG